MLMQTELFEKLDTRAPEDSPALIIVDTLTDVYPANQNDRAKVWQLIATLRGLALRNTYAVMLPSYPSLRGPTWAHIQIADPKSQVSTRLSCGTPPLKHSQRASHAEIGRVQRKDTREIIHNLEVILLASGMTSDAPIYDVTDAKRPNSQSLHW